MAPLTIAIASGKGGTGKTTVATNLALALAHSQYIDCDVETPNGHLFLHPELRGRVAVTVPRPQIDAAACTLCGRCAQACAFHALAVSRERILIFPELCHGCGVCRYVCPVAGAVSEVAHEIGYLEEGEVDAGTPTPLTFVHGRLQVGETATVALIKAAKQRADPTRIRILDAPAGTACPMVETLQGADYCVLVTEPTPFGLHDLELAVEVARRVGVPCGVVINRCDIGDKAVSDYCRAQGIPVLMEIPFARALAETYARGIPWILADPSWRPRFQALSQAIRFRQSRGCGRD